MKKNLISTGIFLACISCTSTHFDLPSSIESKNATLRETIEQENSFYGVPDSVSLLNISVGKSKTDINGISYFNPELSTISLWSDSQANLTVRNVKEALEGIAYDALENKLIKCENTIFSSQISHQNLPPGEYLICVVLNNNVENGKNAFSIKRITTHQYEKIALKKEFTNQSKNQSLEDWQK